MSGMIYLDNNATTRPSARTVAAMLPYFRECFFNAASLVAASAGAGRPGIAAARALAELLHAEHPESFVFTSGATEANNWIFTAVAEKYPAGEILISSIEHASVAEPAAALSKKGFQLWQLPVDRQGLLRLDRLSEALNHRTRLVSVMAANNETGVLQDLAAIGRLIRRRAPAALFHTDATQAAGKIAISLQGSWRDVDLLSGSAHKFHGPKGIGFLYIRRGLEWPPLIRGGGQQAGRRAGTSNTPALAGLTAAAREVEIEQMSRVNRLRDWFELKLRQQFPSAVFFPERAPRLPNTSCFALPGMDAVVTAGILARRNVLVGHGAACSSRSLSPPKTLLAMGIDRRLACSSLRVSLSRDTTAAELARLLELLTSLAPRGIAPDPARRLARRCSRQKAGNFAAAL